MRSIGAAGALVRRLAHSRAGGVASLFAVCLPVLAVLAGGALDLTSLVSDRQKTQDAVDAAALDGARELSVANVQGVEARTKQYALSQLDDVASRVTLKPTVTIAQNNASLTLQMQGHRPSFFGNLLPLGGWTYTVSATAAPVGLMPLCVLTTTSAGADAGGALSLQGSSQTTARNCLVHSTSDLAVPSPADLTAGTAEAVGSASGQISPAPQTGAPAIPDPFASLNLNIPATCNPLDLLYDLGINILTPGVHCGNVSMLPRTRPPCCCQATTTS